MCLKSDIIYKRILEVAMKAVKIYVYIFFKNIIDLKTSTKKLKL